MKETFLDKVIEKLMDIGLFTLIITYYATYTVAIVGFWYGVYYVIKSLL